MYLELSFEISNSGFIHDTKTGWFTFFVLNSYPMEPGLHQNLAILYPYNSIYRIYEYQVSQTWSVWLYGITG